MSIFYRFWVMSHWGCVFMLYQFIAEMRLSFCVDSIGLFALIIQASHRQRASHQTLHILFLAHDLRNCDLVLMHACETHWLARPASFIQGLLSLYMVGSACAQWKIGGNIFFIYIVHFDICTAFCPKCFWWRLVEVGGEEAPGRGGGEPNFDSRFRG